MRELLIYVDELGMQRSDGRHESHSALMNATRNPHAVCAQSRRPNRDCLRFVLGMLLVFALSVCSAISQQPRSEEHTSELQSPCNLVCRLLLEKKKTFAACTCPPSCPSPARRTRARGTASCAGPAD